MPAALCATERAPASKHLIHGRPALRAVAAAAALLPLLAQAITADLTSLTLTTAGSYSFGELTLTGETAGLPSALKRGEYGIGISNPSSIYAPQGTYIDFDDRLKLNFTGLSGATNLVFDPANAAFGLSTFYRYTFEAIDVMGNSLGLRSVLKSSLLPIDVSGLYGPNSGIRSLYVTNTGSAFGSLFAAAGISYDLQPVLQNNWIGGSNNLWDTPGNWTNGYTPQSHQTTEIRPNTGVTITGPGQNTQIQNLRLGNAGVGRSVLQMGGGDLHVTGNVENQTGGELRLGGRTVNAGDVQNAGQIRGSGQLSTTSFTNQVSGRVVVGAGERMVIAAGSMTNYGALDNQGGELELTDITNFGQINNRGTLRVTNSVLKNAGSIRFGAGLSEVYGGVHNDDGASILLAGAAEVLFYDLMDNNGTITLPDSVSFQSQVVFFGGLTGSGSVRGGGTVIIHTALAPTQQMSISGRLQLADDNLFVVDGLAGSMERVTVQGTAALDGVFGLNLASGGWGAGGAYTVLSATGGITGQFDGLTDGAKVGSIDGLDYFIRYGSNEVTIFTPVPEPQTYALMAVGLALMGWMQRRRRVRGA